jgi:hypothetical protein
VIVGYWPCRNKRPKGKTKRNQIDLIIKFQYLQVAGCVGLQKENKRWLCCDLRVGLLSSYNARNRSSKKGGQEHPSCPHHISVEKRGSDVLQFDIRGPLSGFALDTGAARVRDAQLVVVQTNSAGRALWG